MVSQNTVSRTELTEKDKTFINICKEISKKLRELIEGHDEKKSFWDDYGKISYTRDAGQGRGGGKLQRDALCTRGRQAKAPFSNRNLRWHPLVLSNSCPDYFLEIDRINVDRDAKELIFVIDNEEYRPSDVYKLERPYCIKKEHWKPLTNELKKWTQDDWINNWCTIPILEYSPHLDAIESFAALGVVISVGLFNLSLDKAYDSITSLFKESNIEISSNFPKKSLEMTQCPLCRSPIGKYPAGLEPRKRELVWKPLWQKTKRIEGEDQSIQLMHVEPLIEAKINHNASNVRYGHRWCNVAMTDHSIDDVILFMKEICEIS